MSSYSNVPIEIIHPQRVSETQQEVVEQIIREQFRRWNDQNNDYKEFRVELTNNPEGELEKITVHMLYADRYLFETKEIFLDREGKLR
jgi:hypothetical protein